MQSPVRYRLVGAIVLTFLAVLVLPWLLDGAGYELLQEVEKPIPDRPDFVPPQRPAQPLANGSAPDAVIGGADARLDSTVGNGTGPAPVPASPRSSASARTKVAPTAGTPASTASGTVGWAVQVGSFGQEANAREQMQRLREAGFQAFSERASADGRVVWRVKVGPRAERDAALQLRDDIQRRMELPGIVIAHP